MSPVILVYMPPSCLDAGSRASWIVPLLHLLRSRCARQARRPRKPMRPTYVLDVRRGLVRPHRETSFSRLRRGQAVRASAHAVHVLCRYPRRVSFLPICPDSSGPHCFSAICCHPPRGDPDGSLYAARIGREQVPSE